MCSLNVRLDTNHSCVDNLRMFKQQCFKFSWSHLGTSNLDQLLSTVSLIQHAGSRARYLSPIHDIPFTPVISVGDITGLQPSIAGFRLGRFPWFTPITLHDIWPSNPEFPRSTGAQFLCSVLRYQFGRGSWHKLSHGCRRWACALGLIPASPYARKSARGWHIPNNCKVGLFQQKRSLTLTYPKLGGLSPSLTRSLRIASSLPCQQVQPPQLPF